MVSARETASAYIDDNPVMVFSKSYCPSCKDTKELLKNKSAQIGFKYKVIELDQMDEGAAIQDALVEKSDNERTVPNIFIMGVHQKGGNDKIQKMGPKLDQLLQKVAEAEASAAQESNSPVSESA